MERKIGRYPVTVEHVLSTTITQVVDAEALATILTAMLQSAQRDLESPE